MGDSENMDQSSKKRCASTQLTPENRDLDNEEDSAELQNGTFKKASDDVLATRRIVKVKRKETSAASQTPNPFAGIRLVPSTAPATAAVETNTPMAASKSSPAEATVDSKQKTLEDGKSDATLESNDIKAKVDNNNQCEKKSDDQGTDADTVEGTDQTADPVEKDSGGDKTEIKEKEGDDASEETDKNGDNSPLSSFQQHSAGKNAFTGLASTESSGSSFSFGLIPQDGSTGSASLFGQTTNLPSFNFDFAKNGNSSLFGGSSSSIINKSKASSAFPPKQEVSVETGEEKERVAFSADSVMFEYLDGGWKERGKGEVKVNVSSTSNGKSRLVMRSKGNYRLILNASLYPEMKLTSMDKKGITFACVNSIEEGKEGLSTFALKFKDPLVVDTFRAAVHKHKDSKPVEPAAAEAAEAPLKTPENSPTDE